MYFLIVDLDHFLKEKQMMQWSFDDIRILSTGSELSGDPSQSPKSDDSTSIVTGSKSMLVCMRVTVVVCPHRHK